MTEFEVSFTLAMFNDLRTVHYMGGPNWRLAYEELKTYGRSSLVHDEDFKGYCYKIFDFMLRNEVITKLTQSEKPVGFVWRNQITVKQLSEHLKIKTKHVRVCLNYLQLLGVITHFDKQRIRSSFFENPSDEHVKPFVAFHKWFNLIMLGESRDRLIDTITVMVANQLVFVPLINGQPAPSYDY